jgi:hypothetical protein
MGWLMKPGRKYNPTTPPIHPKFLEILKTLSKQDSKSLEI